MWNLVLSWSAAGELEKLLFVSKQEERGTELLSFDTFKCSKLVGDVHLLSIFYIDIKMYDIDSFYVMQSFNFCDIFDAELHQFEPWCIHADQTDNAGFFPRYPHSGIVRYCCMCHLENGENCMLSSSD
jgi:hypothetical protein